MTGKTQLRKAFQQPYNRNNFVNEVIYSVFQKKNNVEIYDIPKNLTNELQPSYQKLIKKVAVYGQIGLDDGAKITLYEIVLCAGVKLENNKVGIQKYIRSIIIAGEGILVNFVREDKPKNWRLTLITSDSQMTEKGIKDKHSNTKRYTYLLGENEACRTIAERFEEIEKSTNICLFEPKDKKTASVFNAFSVEKLSKTFFDEYKVHYERFCQHLQNSDQRKYIFNISFPDKATKDEKEKLSKPIRDFVKKTLGRIVFLYFVQKKGWLGATDTNYTDGNQHFMMDLFDNSGGDGNFYHLHLSELFFKALNTPRPNDAYTIPQKPFMSPKITTHEVCVPFLNGGLFEKEAFEDKIITFEPALFHNPAKSDDPKQRGFLDFLNAYNFTIYEDSADDHTVAVDPEMLGHIFENLLEDNKDKGAFYTPKEIVHYMCQESLLEYLNTKLQSNPKQKEELLLLIKYSEKSEYITQKQTEINSFLDNVKICDPAIGSGAFPMGMLQEIFKMKMLLNPNLDKAQAKKHIIQNAIYGVDIEKGAVDIARLRFWLSLIVDETKPQALPNLDYKIMQGNSLVSKFEGEIIDIDWEIKGNQNNDFKKEIRKNLDEFNQYKQRFFNTDKDKDKLKEKIRIAKINLLKSILSYDKAKYEAQKLKNVVLFDLTPKERKEQAEIAIKLKGYTDALQKLEKAKLVPNKTLDFFDWKLDFADVLNPAVNENTGFDIVVGNPPYNAKLTALEITFLQNKYISAKTITGVQKGSLDSFVLFIELGHNMTNKGGNLHYIVPISITSSDAVSGVHKLIESDCSIIKVSSYSVRPQPVFENAVVNTSILFFRRDGIACKEIFSTKMYRKDKKFNLKHLVENLEFIEAKNLKLVGRYPKISLDIERKILTKIFSNNFKIGDLLREDGKKIFYRFAGGRYFKVITNYSTGSSAEKSIIFDENIADSIGAILSSNLFFWFYQIFSDNLNLKSYEIEVFGIPFKEIDEKTILKLEKIYAEYLADIESNSNIRQTKKYANIDEFREYKIGKSKHLIDKIDDIICPLYGLTKEETTFVKNYELNYRVSDK